MNIRKRKRAKLKLTPPLKMILGDMNINEMVKNMINSAIKGEEEIDVNWKFHILLCTFW